MKETGKIKKRKNTGTSTCKDCGTTTKNLLFSDSYDGGLCKRCYENKWWMR